MAGAGLLVAVPDRSGEEVMGVGSLAGGQQGFPRRR